jgi:hypothetical protein
MPVAAAAAAAAPVAVVTRVDTPSDGAVTREMIVKQQVAVEALGMKIAALQRRFVFESTELSSLHEIFASQERLRTMQTAAIHNRMSMAIAKDMWNETTVEDDE